MWHQDSKQQNHWDCTWVCVVVPEVELTVLLALGLQESHFATEFRLDPWPESLFYPTVLLLPPIFNYFI